MRRLTRRHELAARLGPFLLAVGMIALAWKGEPVFAEDLTIGDPAPDFTLPGSDGRTYSLSSYRGKQVVVLAWFPKAFTGG